MWNLILVYLEIVLVSVQDRWTVCARRTIGSVIILGAPMVLCMVYAEHTISSEIVLDTPVGTPR